MAMSDLRAQSNRNGTEMKGLHLVIERTWAKRDNIGKYSKEKKVIYF